MRRRDVIALGSAAVLAGSVGSRAQHVAVPVIGWLGTESAGSFEGAMHAFRQGLSQSGYVEGRNVALEFRWAEGQNTRLPDFASELARRPVALIATHGAGALAAKAATTTIPIVFLTGGDPVQIGLVKSLQRPDGNLTGVTDLNVEVASKRLELLREFVPLASSFALLVNSANPARAETVIRETRAAASTLGVQLEVLNASANSDLDAVFAKIPSLNVGGLVISADSFFAGRVKQLGTLAARHQVPTVFAYRDFALAGGLASYGSNTSEMFLHVGIYSGRILKGEKPADLPVHQSTKVELIINLKTARDRGLTVPPALLARADEVIE
jgi:putative tryptophan/tyrosine transport system substrate-binding protein